MINQISPEFLQVLVQSFYAVGILIFMSISARFLLIASGQHWVRTFSHTATLLVLPIITFVITKVISGNIALSLGMVGALSIVRFRNPVKSPFELAVYFGSITMGITASVSLPWLFFFGISITFAILTLVILDFLSKKIFSKPLFQTSFTEGNQLSTLEVVTLQNNKDLMNSAKLISHIRNDQGHTYILASDDIKELKAISSGLESDQNIKSLQLNS
jgi:hypothetical protein